ncbi:major head protein [Rhodovulum phage RS1]|uniref:major head protein n=1 Tax=Rhodobacter phage RC1 TaxID=754055 RepID=UPI0002C186F4|nr:major head protein [Rhodobacter phage RC1]YP_007676421.1 major head protein [Rhodovulum phage RS1]AGH58007.1 major head protein [Rhodovulum phage RS1]AGH58035.1 major head subunit [Rhodobacter phage RC1]
MQVTAANLDALRVGFKTSFQGALDQAPSQYLRLTTVVPSSTKEQRYGWMGKIPNVREWIGPRAIQNLTESDYSIREKPWELTIGVDRDDIETDNLGIYSPLFQEMGRSAGSKWDMLVFELLKLGFATECYDGQNFFDTDHPVLDEDGKTVTVSNTGGGTGTPWFLLDTTRALKPIILQKRRDFQFVSKTKLDDDHVFMNKEFLYGTDARANVGFGFWQMAYGSKQTLDGTAYAAARAALSGMKGDYGRPLGLMPNLLVVPPALEEAGRKILNSENASGGETNPWKGTAELLVVPWLA